MERIKLLIAIIVFTWILFFFKIIEWTPQNSEIYWSGYEMVIE
jgi:uncharacterized protein YggT (Ycf19 family)